MYGLRKPWGQSYYCPGEGPLPGGHVASGFGFGYVGIDCAGPLFVGGLCCGGHGVVGGGSMGASLGVRWGLLSVGVGLCATSKVESTAYSAGKLQWQLLVVSILDSLWLLFEAAFAVLKGLILSTAQVQW